MGQGSAVRRGGEEEPAIGRAMEQSQLLAQGLIRGDQRGATREERSIAGYVRARMDDLGWAEVISPTHPEMTGSISTFRLHGVSEMDLCPSLRDHHRITVPASRREDQHTLRVPTHLYNTFAEIDRLVNALVELRAEAS